MRTWDKLSAGFVRGLKKPGKFYDGGGLMLQAKPTKTKGVVTKAWLYRYQIDKRERVMGIGSARVVSLAEARAEANKCRSLLARGIDPMAHRDAERMAARSRELHTQTFKQCLDGFLASRGDNWREVHRKQWESSMATYAKPLFDINVADVDVTAVLRVIEPQWKRARRRWIACAAGSPRCWAGLKRAACVRPARCRPSGKTISIKHCRIRVR